MDEARKKQGNSPAAFLAQRGLPLLRPLLTSTRLEYAGLILFAGFLAAIFVFNIVRPEFNWDMAAYIASSLKLSGLSAADLHAQTWSLMQANAPAEQFQKLTAGNDYNTHTYRHPEAFASMLPLYDVKLAYVLALHWLGRLIGPVEAAVWLSAATSLSFGLTCLWWMRRAEILQAAPIVACIMVLCGYFYMGNIATPDLMVATFFMLGCERFLRGKDIQAVVLVYGAFLVRPENILFLFTLLLTAILFRMRLLPTLIGFLAAVAAYVGITSGTDHPGWWAHFYFSCIEIQNTLVGFSPQFSPALYVQGVARGIFVSLRDNNWILIFALVLLGWWLLVRNGRTTPLRATALLTALVLTIIGKFVVFPLPDDRTYMMLIVAMALVLLETWKPNFSISKAPAAN